MLRKQLGESEHLLPPRVALHGFGLRAVFKLHVTSGRWRDSSACFLDVGLLFSFRCVCLVC